tara:strand:- start:2299 stop:3330 length:1032 start_codon:yes stop_codon:yes gene_type:complete
MPFSIQTGQVDSESFRVFLNKKLSGSNSYTSGFYTHDNKSGFVSLTEGGANSFTGYSGDIMTRVSGLSTQLSGTLNTSGELNWQKSKDVSGHAEAYTNSASGYLQSEIETASGNFSTVSGEFLKSGSIYHSGSGDFKASDSITGALAYSSGHDDSQGLFVATGDTVTRDGWMKLAGYPEMTGYVSTSSGDIKSSLNATGLSLSTSISNITSESSTVFSAEKTFNSGLKTDKVTFGDGSVKLIANANESITFNDPSGALLTLAAGYDTDAPVFSVTDKAGMPLMDIFEDDRINMGPYGKDIFTISGLQILMRNLPVYPNTGSLPEGALYVSGNTAAGGRHLMIA